jgi:hypothetical protein
MNIERFLGLDLRTGDRAAGSLDIGDEVRIDSRGSVVRRPGLVLTATLPNGTAGLYCADDLLRAAAVNGTSSAGLHPAVYLDYVDALSVGGRVDCQRLPSGRRVLWIEQVGGGPSQLHITKRAVEDAVTGSRINISWSPRGLLFLGARLWSLDNVRGLLEYSGVADPDVNDGEGYTRTWDDLADPDEAKNGGFAYIAQMGSAPQGIAEYMGQVAVFAQNAIQILEVGSAGAVAVSATIAGPGTRHPSATATMSGDLIYADIGGTLRLLSQDAQTGGASEDTIGTPVQPMSVGLLGYSDTPRAVYARQLGCYLMASGGTVMCLSILPGAGPLGWSRWNLPVTVDAITECRGVVSIRSGNNVYGLYENAPDDEVATGDRRSIDPVVRLNQLGNGIDLVTPTKASAVISEAVQMRLTIDGRETPDGTLPGRAPSPSTRRGGWPGYRHGIRIASVAATPAWRCDSMNLE